MSKRLRLGLLVIVAELSGVAVCLQVSAAAQATGKPREESAVAVEAVPLAVHLETAKKKPVAEAINAPRYVPGGDKENSAAIEEPVLEANGSIRMVPVVRDVKQLRELYLELHRHLAEKLTAEQLAEKCKALRKELNEIDAEDEIEQIQKQLSELKRKNDHHKGISTRVQRAIEALKNTGKDVGGREL